MKRPAACEPAEIGAEKTQGTASGMKRPASKAVASSLRKRPASKAVPSSPRKRALRAKLLREKFCHHHREGNATRSGQTDVDGVGILRAAVQVAGAFVVLSLFEVAVFPAGFVSPWR